MLPAVMPVGGVKAGFHIGDTPMDVQAAIAAGSIAVGVTTGVYTREQLEQSANGAAPGSVAILDNLENVEQVLKVLQLQ